MSQNILTRIDAVEPLDNGAVRLHLTFGFAVEDCYLPRDVRVRSSAVLNAGENVVVSIADTITDDMRKAYPDAGTENVITAIRPRLSLAAFNPDVSRNTV